LKMCGIMDYAEDKDTISNKYPLVHTLSSADKLISDRRVFV
jgi:hypothetical protein